MGKTTAPAKPKEAAPTPAAKAAPAQPWLKQTEGAAASETVKDAPAGTKVFDETGKELQTTDNKSNAAEQVPTGSPTPDQQNGYDTEGADQARVNAALEDHGDGPIIDHEDIRRRVGELTDDERDEFEQATAKAALATLTRIERNRQANEMVLNFVEPGTHFGTMAENARAGEVEQGDEDETE